MVGQGSQFGPQTSGPVPSPDQQLSPQRKVPSGQASEHEVPSQLAVPPIGTGQGLQEVPQLLILSLATQLPEQS